MALMAHKKKLEEEAKARGEILAPVEALTPNLPIEPDQEDGSHPMNLKKVRESMTLSKTGC